MSNNLIVQLLRCLLLTGIVVCNQAMSAPVEDVLGKVQEAALQQLQNQAVAAAWLEPEFALEVVKTNRQIPPCHSGVSVQSLDPRGFSRMRFAAVCGGAAGWRYEFMVRAKVSARVAVAANDLMAGKILSLSDLLQERHDITLVPDTFADLTLLDGMAARRTIRAGEVLRPNMLQAPMLVKRGDQVRIVARREQIEVSMAGEALDNGARGGVVRVRNSSGTVIRARVVEAGVVEPADLAGENR